MVRMIIEIAIGAVLAGMAFRIRGDVILNTLFGTGTAASRLFWASTMAALAWYHVSPWLALAVLVGAFLGCIPGNRDLLPIPEREPPRGHIFAAMRGLIYSGSIAVPLLFITNNPAAWVLFLIGAAAPAIYAVGWHLRVPTVQFWADHAVSEFLLGAWIGGWFCVVVAT